MMESIVQSFNSVIVACHGAVASVGDTVDCVMNQTCGGLADRHG